MELTQPNDTRYEREAVEDRYAERLAVRTVEIRRFYTAMRGNDPEALIAITHELRSSLAEELNPIQEAHWTIDRGEIADGRSALSLKTQAGAESLEAVFAGMQVDPHTLFYFASEVMALPRRTARDSLHHLQWHNRVQLNQHGYRFNSPVITFGY